MEKLFKRLNKDNLDTARMLLDPNNPRYQGDFDDYIYIPYGQVGDKAVQERAFKTMLQPRFGVKDLALSIAEIGYLPIDSFVVTRYGKDSFLVIEGNRRLAAIRLILNGEVPSSEEVLKSIRLIPSFILDEPENRIASDQWLIQGIRHLGGIKEWGPYQKAKTFDVLYKDRGMAYDESAKIMGLKKADVLRVIRTLRAFEELQSNSRFGKRSSPDDFSFFDEMIGKPFLRMFFGWDNKQMKFIDPIKRDFFFECIMGRQADGIRKIPTALSLRKLSDILRKNRELEDVFIKDPNCTVEMLQNLVGTDIIAEIERFTTQLKESNLNRDQIKRLGIVVDAMCQLLERER